MSDAPILPDEPVSNPSERTMRGAVGPRDARLAPGSDLLGRYTVLEELGQGGMSVVYKCLDCEGGIEVAIKGLPSEVTRNRDELDEIRENYQIVAKLHHSAISGLRYLERDPESGDYYVVMDLAEGEDLSRILRCRRGVPVPLSEALDILRPLASALDYAHGEGVLHRDVKPANVKVRPSAVPGDPPRVQLLDFGLAAQVRSSMSRVSMRGHVGTSGTPAYMAPEQWEARRQTGATDQYALAVVAYEMLSGAPPFAADDTDLLRSAVLTRDPDPVDGLPEAANAALLRALAKNPKDRFPSCTAFVAALGRGRDASAKRPSRLPLAVAALLAVAAGALWFAQGRNGAETPGGPPAPVADVSPAEPSGGASSPSDPPSPPSSLSPSTPSVPVPPPEGAPLADLKDARARLEFKRDALASEGYAATDSERAPVEEALATLAARIEESEAEQARQAREAELAALAAAQAAAEVESARTYKDGKLWKQCLTAADKALGWEPGNKEAKALKKTAEAELKKSADAKADAKRKAKEETARKAAEKASQAEPLTEEETPHTPLAGKTGDIFVAVQMNDIGLIKSILALNPASATIRAKSGCTPLHYAAAINRQEAAYLLLKAGVSPDILVERSQTTPLHWAADANSEDVLRLLLLNKATVDARAKNGFTPLHLAARNGLTNCVLRLLAAGADPNAAVQQGQTPLHLAAVAGNTSTIRILLDAGADSEIVDVNGRVPAELATTPEARNAFRMKSASRRARTPGVPQSAGNVALIDLGGGVTLEMVRCPGVAPDFWIGKYEVTQEQWQRVMGTRPSYFKDKPKNPVETVSWYDCQAFVEKLNALPAAKASGQAFRLPTEEEWKTACRAGAPEGADYCKLADGTQITMSNLSRVARYGENWDDGPGLVGRFEPNAWGLYDMHGNVWEWTQTTDGSRRVSRGGGFYSPARDCSTGRWFRCNSKPDSRVRYIGLRLAASDRTGGR